MESQSSAQPVPPEPPTLSSMFLAGVQRMDPAEWSRLVNTFGPIVYRWCRTSGVNESDAADVVQEVFSSVARGIVKFERCKQTGSFRSWLATITRNRVRDHFRKQCRGEQAAGGTQAYQWLQQQEEALDTTICAENTQQSIVQRIVANVQAEFEAPTWQAFWLTAVEGKTAAEAAAACGLSVASIYQSKSRVLRRLRQRLAEVPE